MLTWLRDRIDAMCARFEDAWNWDDGCELEQRDD